MFVSGVKQMKCAFDTDASPSRRENQDRATTMKDQSWFEMRDIRRRRLEGSVWIPVRKMATDRVGDYGHEGYREDFVSIAALAAAEQDRSTVEDLSVPNLGRNGWGHHGVVENSSYVPADVYDHYGKFAGIHLVLEQNFNGLEDPVEWHLHQDLALTLDLKREEGVWVRPAEGYTVVAREHRVDGRQELIEVRSGHLKDYLCARGLGLVVVTYRSRTEIRGGREGIGWPEGGAKESEGGDRWEGRVAEIHEGGGPYGVETAMFHVARTDVDGGEDVPVMGRPNDDNVSSRSWRTKDSGRKLYRICGELWRTEWIPPGSASPIVRNDGPPPAESFIVDADGNEERGPQLGAEGRWLWFKPELATAIAHRRGGRLKWYTRETGVLGCSGHDVHFGVNSSGLLNAYAKDVVQLPGWLHRTWAGYNVAPEGGVCEELLASQVRADPADTLAPEAFLERVLLRFDEVTREKLAPGVLRAHDKVGDLLRATHRFRAVSEEGLLAMAKDLCRLTADRIDAGVLQTIVGPSNREKWGSLKSLEKVLASRVQPERARAMLTPLVGMYELRLADAHLPDDEYAVAFEMAGVDRDQPLVMQGRDLLVACLDALYRISAVIDDNW